MKNKIHIILYIGLLVIGNMNMIRHKIFKIKLLVIILLSSSPLTYANKTTSLGDSSKADGNESTALGYNTWAHSDQSTAIGASAGAEGENATAIGHKSTAIGDNTLSLGSGATSIGNGAISIGSGAVSQKKMPLVSVKILQIMQKIVLF